MIGSSNLYPNVGDGEIFYLTKDENSIVVIDDNNSKPVEIAKVNPEYRFLVALLLRQAQMGAQVERVMDHYLADIGTRTVLLCPLLPEVKDDQEES